MPVGRPTTARDALAGLSARHLLPPEIATDIRNAADIATARHREHLVERAESAYGAYERGRYQDALRAIKPVADEAPGRRRRARAGRAGRLPVRSLARRRPATCRRSAR